MKKGRRKLNRKFIFTLSEKFEILVILIFILSLFLLDVNANLIGAYGKDIPVHIYKEKTVPATSMFWLGFISAFVCLIFLGTRNKYNIRRRRVTLDLIFLIFGIIGLMIILSGGILLFWHNNLLEIPFFSYNVARITYYHIGIGLEVIVLFYYALFK